MKPMLRSRRCFPLLALFAATTISMATARAAAAEQVIIKRDQYGIPHIYARDLRGLYFGYGYAVAEDRLYQMEMVKRSAEGTVAAVLGPKYVAVDEATRASLNPASLHRQLAALSPADRAIFQGYAEGFNARIREVMAHQATLLPREFIDGRFRPTRWSAYDVAAVCVGLIVDRFFSGDRELANLRLLNELKEAKGPEQGAHIYQQLRWLDDPTAPTIQATGTSQAGGSRAGGRLAAYLQPVSSEAARGFQTLQAALMGPVAAQGMPTASYAWVLAPSRTADGHAVLFNGPQQGWFSPSIIYGVGLHGAGFDVTGNTPVGLPAILFGTNGRIAWGSTVGALDTNDLYQEHLDPHDPHRYLFRGVYRRMNERRQQIQVRGEPARSFIAYSTVHGPVEAWDLPRHTAYALKCSWRGHEIETLLGWIHVAQARDWSQFLHQAARIAVSITWFYADVGGNIGYAGLGRLPERPASSRFSSRPTATAAWSGGERSPSQRTPGSSTRPVDTS